MLKATKENDKWHTRELLSGYKLISQQKLYKPEENDRIHLKGEREEPTIKNTLCSKTLLQILWRNQNLSRQAKVKRIQHCQTSFTANAKVPSLGRKHKRRKRPMLNKFKLIKKLLIGSYISIITLNVNWLNAPTKGHKPAGWMETCAWMPFYLPHHSSWHHPSTNSM